MPVQYSQVTDSLIASLLDITGPRNVIIDEARENYSRNETQDRADGRIKQAFDPCNIPNPGKVLYTEI